MFKLYQCAEGACNKCKLYKQCLNFNRIWGISEKNQINY